MRMPGVYPHRAAAAGSDVLDGDLPGPVIDEGDDGESVDQSGVRLDRDHAAADAHGQATAPSQHHGKPLRLLAEQRDDHSQVMGALMDRALGRLKYVE